jgi:2-haloacid dehalogenase
MRYKWILLDADGTLFDYDRAEATALEATFAEFGLEYAPEHARDYRRINAQIWRDYELGNIAQDVLRVRRFDLLFGAIGFEADASAFSARYLAHLGDQAVLIPGAEEVVHALHGQVGLVMITNGIKEVQRSRLAKSTIADCFAGVVISDEVGVSKPDPGIFSAALALMGHPEKHEVLIVGDSLSADIRGGAEYGIDTCWFNPAHKPRPEEIDFRYEIDALRDLLDLVETHEVIVTRYAAGIQALDDVLDGLSEADLDLARAEARWTIREIVHHIADAEDLWEIAVKSALGNSGCLFDLSWYIIDNKWAEPLQYAVRPVGEALALYRALRRQVLELLAHVPDPWEKHIRLHWADPDSARVWTVDDIVSWQARHVMLHVEQIRETREAHHR